MGPKAVVALRVLLVVLLLGSFAAQLVFFPVLAGQLAEVHPELAWLRWPLLAVVVLAILVGQVVLGAVWVLLTMVEHESVFSDRAYVWVDVLIAAGLVDAALVLGVNAFLSFGLHANPPGLMLTLLALTVAGSAFSCLMVVMKGLLRKAASLQAELSEVI